MNLRAGPEYCMASWIRRMRPETAETTHFGKFLNNIAQANVNSKPEVEHFRPKSADLEPNSLLPHAKAIFDQPRPKLVEVLPNL